MPLRRTRKAKAKVRPATMIRYEFSRYECATFQTKKSVQVSHISPAIPVFFSTGCISPDDFAAIVRMLGANPSEKEVAAYKKEIGKDKILFDDLLKMIPKVLSARPRDTVDDLMECFQVFDKDGNGYISVPELKHIYCGLGEKFSEEEFEDMRKAIDDGSGMIAYEDFAKLMVH